MGTLDNPPQPYPGRDEVELEINEYCSALVANVKGARPELVLSQAWGVPTQQEWDGGTRQVSCFVGLYGNRTITGHLVP
jgi:hypothetical protein